VKQFLRASFPVKDLGELKHFLGIEVARFAKGIVFLPKKACFRCVDK
jgi:hypothetical protein